MWIGDGFIDDFLGSVWLVVKLGWQLEELSSNFDMIDK